MPEFDNMEAKPIIVDGEVVAINFANRFDEDTAMRIVKKDDFCWAKKFTDKKYVNYLEWHYAVSYHTAAEIYRQIHVKIFLKDKF